MGYFVIEVVLGYEVIFYIVIFNLFFNLFFFILGIYFLFKGSISRGFLIKLFISFVIIVIVIGFFLFVIGFRLF